MKLKVPEKYVQKQILQYLWLQGVFCWQNDSVGVFDPVKRIYRTAPQKIKGVADILGIYRGKPLAIEVKSIKGKLREDQKVFLDRFRDEGGLAFVARSLDDVMKGLL